MMMLLKLVFASAVAAADVPLEEEHLSLLQTRVKLQDGNGKITTNTSVVECPITENPRPECIMGHELKERYGTCTSQHVEPCRGPPKNHVVLPNVHQVGWYTGATTMSANMEFVDVGAGPFKKDGWLVSAKFWVQDARLNSQDGTSCPSGRCPLKGDKGFHFRIYTYGFGGGSYTLLAKGENIVFTVDGGIQEVKFKQPLPFKKNNLLGFAHDGTGNIPFDYINGAPGKVVSHGPPKNDVVGCMFTNGQLDFCQKAWNGGASAFSYQITWTDEEPRQPTVEEPADEEPTGEEPAGDEAAAVADPHLQMAGGGLADMCCEGEGSHRHCKPCQ